MNQQKLIKDILKIYPDIAFKEGDNYYWSPSNQTVYFGNNETSEGLWALLHESGHAILKHIHYYSDIQLVSMELQAWEKAKEIAVSHNIEIDEDHIQDCLDSYRDWIHKRSLCPDCNLAGLQINTHTYSCVFCNNKWKVSTERFCRPYRRKTLEK
ncbi:MAG: hypothetical protein Q7T41_00850 [Candidatus Saccharibacteria bacterium]|nr:hypothetical protein [Candidatus Saccharibacteria bacterium]